MAHSEIHPHSLGFCHSQCLGSLAASGILSDGRTSLSGPILWLQLGAHNTSPDLSFHLCLGDGSGRAKPGDSLGTLEHPGLSFACVSQGQTKILLPLCASLGKKKKRIFIPRNPQEEAENFGLNGPSALVTSCRCQG